ncbi:hypothetical protein BH10ACT11_BH10ACT11_05520 [soil metagenome]
MHPGRRVGDRIERSIEDRVAEPTELDEGLDDPKGQSLYKRAFWLAVTGISLYLVAPNVIDVIGSWRQLSEVGLAWFPLLAALQFLSLACLWLLQKVALPKAPLASVIDSQLAGNALSKVAPGGGAVGAALQFKMLVGKGLTGAEVGAALAAVNVITFAVVLALPVLALPTFIGGSVDDSLVEAAVISVVVFVVLAALAAILITSDRALGWTGRTVEGLRNRLRRKSDPLTKLPERLRRERDRLLTTLGKNWKEALLATIGRWAFDYGILLAALAAVGSHALPALTLLAFCTAQLLAQIPATPGGLGFVEAGLTATLALAGVGAADAVLATFIYRLFSYWLPLPIGLAAYAFHQRRLRGSG